MTKNEFGELVCTREEYDILQDVLESKGVTTRLCMLSGDEYHVQVLNHYKDAVLLFPYKSYSGDNLQLDFVKSQMEISKRI